MYHALIGPFDIAAVSQYWCAEESEQWIGNSRFIFLLSSSLGLREKYRVHLAWLIKRLICRLNLIWPLWSTTLVHILWRWRFWGACENSRSHFGSLEASNLDHFWYRPTQTIWLWFSGGWVARYAWKWEKIGKIQKAISCGRPPNLQALSFYYVLVEGVGFKRQETPKKKNAEHDTKNIR